MFCSENKGKNRFARKSSIKGKFILHTTSMNFGNVKALNNISFEIEPQSRIGIIGPSGAGKTTILNLLAGVFPPSGGSVDVDGIRITQYDLSYYRSKVILLNQTPVFFQGTIEDNLFRVAPNVGHRELEDIFYISGFDEHLNKSLESIDLSIVGMPNVGKSSFINKILNKN